MVEQIMQRNFAQACPDESIDSARGTMRMGRLRHLLVTRDETLLGVLSYRDLLEWLVRADRGASERARVADLMQQAPLTIAPDATLAEASDCLCRYRLGCLPVVDGAGNLLGLITETDLLRAAYGPGGP